MSKAQVDIDLHEYLRKAENLRNEDKLNYLRALFDKHFTFTKLDHKVTKNELYNIVSDAKNNMTKQRIRPHVSGRIVDQSELPSLAMIEAFISYCNRHDLLKKNVGFDYTDEPDFESIED